MVGSGAQGRTESLLVCGLSRFCRMAHVTGLVFCTMFEVLEQVRRTLFGFHQNKVFPDWLCTPEGGEVTTLMALNPVGA